MLHTFRLRGDCLAYDNESGALMFVDERAMAVLEAYGAAGGEAPSAEARRALARALDCAPAEIDEICAEIEVLKAEGSLFAPAPEIELKQLYPDAPRIKAMCLHLCHDCNLRCRYCFAETGDYGSGRRSMLSLETGKKAVDFLIEASGPRRNLDIDFFGGEPLLNWPVVVALTHYCEEVGPRRNKEIRLTLTTNATLLDEEKTDFLNAHMKNVVLSLDGREQVNDYMRPRCGGQGSYAQVLANIKRFIARRGTKEHYVRGTYTAHNLDFAQDVRHFFAEGLRRVSVEPVVAPESCDYALKEGDLARICAEYEALAALYLEARRGGEEVQFFHFNVDVEGGPCLYKRMKGCGVGTEYCAVTPEGDIYPCHQFVGEADFLLGNVHEEPPLRRTEQPEGRFAELILPNKPGCRDCWAKYFCGGGCAANNYHASGRLDGLYELGCALQKKRLEAALWVQAKLREGD